MIRERSSLSTPLLEVQFGKQAPAGNLKKLNWRRLQYSKGNLISSNCGNQIEIQFI